jgi:hypothetical protein
MSFVKRYIHRRLESYQSRIKSKYINVKKKVYKRIEDTLQNERIHNLIMRILDPPFIRTKILIVKIQIWYYTLYWLDIILHKIYKKNKKLEKTTNHGKNLVYDIPPTDFGHFSFMWLRTWDPWIKSFLPTYLLFWPFFMI